MMWNPEFSVPDALGRAMAELDAVWSVFTTSEPGPEDFDRLVAAATAVHELSALARFEAATALHQPQPQPQPQPHTFSSLGLNDRIRFAGALFGGDVEALREACGEMDRLADKREAAAWLKSRCGEGLGWSDPQSLPARFLEWFERVRP
jgi:hypothetical protein